MSLTFNRKNLVTFFFFFFFVIHFIDILTLFLVYSWIFWISSFDLFSFLSQNGISIKMKRFCFSNKFGGIMRESSKLFLHLISSLTELLMNSYSQSPFQNLSIILLTSTSEFEDISFAQRRSWKSVLDL